jgi:cytochrome c-type biogenesis protein CcmE
MALRRLCLRGADLEPLVGAPISGCSAPEGGALDRHGGRREQGAMTPRRKRLLVVIGILGGVAASVALAVMASRENIMFYFDPTQVATGKAPQEKRFRIGGMVVKGSVARNPGDLQVRFVLTDFAHEVPVEYTGVLPDLFREGQGIIAHGKMNAHGAFVADEVLAKHDEKYMPPEVAASLKNKPAGAPTSGPSPVVSTPAVPAPPGPTS